MFVPELIIPSMSFSSFDMICYVHTVSIFITNQFDYAQLTIPKSVLSVNKDKYILLVFFFISFIASLEKP